MWNKTYAEDAPQEILIKMVPNWIWYEGKSKFDTWVYRITTNYLIDQKKKTLFEKAPIISEELINIEEPISYNAPDKDLLGKEMKTGCTFAMLQ